MTDGFFSFDTPYTSFIPRLYPVDGRYLAAPFWSDVDITNGVGTIRYEVHSCADATIENGTPLQNISDFISNEEDVVFEAEWMLVAEWDDVPAYAASTSVVKSEQISELKDSV